MLESKKELIYEIKKAVRNSVNSLYKNHPETFYYITLITDEEGNRPFLSAWSKEALEEILLEEENPEEARNILKWSYADSPYCMYKDKYFDIIQEIFDKRESLKKENTELEFLFRMESMEKAMKDLDEEGLFGEKDSRFKIVINAEVMPPDNSNTERAMRLNPIEALSEWLKEIAEEL